MLPEIAPLLIIQDRDQKITAAQRELDIVPKEKKKAAEILTNDQNAVDAAKKNLTDNEIAIKNLELDIGTRKTTIEKLHVQQFETKKNEEYTKIGGDVIRYEEEIDKLETRELDLLEKRDELQHIFKEKDAGLKKVQTILEKNIAELEIKSVEAQKKIDALFQEREELIKQADPQLLDLYNRLLKSKGANVLVILNGTQCEGCHMKVVPTTATKVQTESEVAQCDNCGRILYNG